MGPGACPRLASCSFGLCHFAGHLRPCRPLRTGGASRLVASAAPRIGGIPAAGMQRAILTGGDRSAPSAARPPRADARGATGMEDIGRSAVVVPGHARLQPVASVWRTRLADITAADPFGAASAWLRWASPAASAASSQGGVASMTGVRGAASRIVQGCRSPSGPVHRRSSLAGSRPSASGVQLPRVW